MSDQPSVAERVLQLDRFTDVTDGGEIVRVALLVAALEAGLEAMERINDTLLHLCAEAMPYMPYYPEMGKRDWHERWAAAQQEQQPEIDRDYPYPWQAR